MIADLIARLNAHRNDGEDFCREICERLDAHIENYSSHIRDLEVLKAWVKDTDRVRSEAITDIIGPVTPTPSAAAPVVVIMDHQKKVAADA